MGRMRPDLLPEIDRAPSTGIITIPTRLGNRDDRRIRDLYAAGPPMGRPLTSRSLGVSLERPACPRPVDQPVGGTHERTEPTRSPFDLRPLSGCPGIHLPEPRLPPIGPDPRLGRRPSTGLERATGIPRRRD